MPDDVRVYAIGDIHGQGHLLELMLQAIERDMARAGPPRPDQGGAGQNIVVFLGDYVDRGGQTPQVLDRLQQGPLPGDRWHFLLGNHEQAMLGFLDDPVGGSRWLDYGGVETLLSYGVPASMGMAGEGRLKAARDGLAANLPESHLAFLRSLDPMVVYGDYAFVHAGIRPGRSLERQVLEDLLWIREPFLRSPKRHEKRIVHGHTITESVEILPNRIGVDTGAFATGILSAVVCENRDARVIAVR